MFREVLRCCSEHGLAVQLPKMKLGLHVTPALGHIVSSEGIQANPKRVEALKNLFPKNREELRSFLGTVGYYDVLSPTSPKLPFLSQN